MQTGIGILEQVEGQSTMTTGEISALADAHLINTYGPRKIAIVRGAGARLWDAEDNEYLDFFAGIAVANLGHCHPAITETIAEQARTLVHVSNLYLIQPQAELAALLSDHSFADRWFFCNSGAEANEAAIKLARRYWESQGTPKPTIITTHGSFHGRTIGALTATGQPKYHEGFAPLPDGFKYVDYDDVDALAKAITPDVGAIILEPIHGEGGVRIPSETYLPAVRKLCDKHGVLLILDEVQTGMGRTGKLFAHEHAGIAPDIMTLAKGLGNGVPIGALGCTENVSSGFAPGTHGSTFGGNPLCTAAALATVKTILDSGVIENAAALGRRFSLALHALKAKHASILDVRAAGLMIGVEMGKPVSPILSAMLERGIICGPAGPNVVRFLPPLIVTEADVDRVVAALDESLGII